jgi:YbgC/YbaW family acyl-CoA thioester hydrolase
MLPEYKGSDYSYTTDYRIRSHECDRQGVVHNSRYLEILEVARIEFCRDVVKIPMDKDTFSYHNKFFFVRNAINYFLPAQFDDEIIIYTRASKVGRTSVTLEQIMNRKRDGSRILEAESVMVYVDEVTNGPKEVEEWMRKNLS